MCKDKKIVDLQNKKQTTTNINNMRKILLPIALTLLILQACSSGGSKKDAPMRETIKLSFDVMTPEV